MHQLTEYILVLNEMTNSRNKFAVCKACEVQVPYNFDYSDKIVNTKKVLGITYNVNVQIIIT